jgi:hypothetical protein
MTAMEVRQCRTLDEYVSWLSESLLATKPTPGAQRDACRGWVRQVAAAQLLSATEAAIIADYAVRAYQWPAGRRQTLREYYDELRAVLTAQMSDTTRKSMEHDWKAKTVPILGQNQTEAIIRYVKLQLRWG